MLNLNVGENLNVVCKLMTSPFFFRHTYYSTPPILPPKNPADLKLHKGALPLQNSDAVIIHSGAMLSMLDLLVSVGSPTQPEVRALSNLSLTLRDCEN